MDFRSTENVITKVAMNSWGEGSQMNIKVRET